MAFSWTQVHAMLYCDPDDSLNRLERMYIEVAIVVGFQLDQSSREVIMPP